MEKTLKMQHPVYPIKSVVYDVDDTLYDFLHLHPAALEQMLERAVQDLGIGREEFLAVYDPTYRQLVDYQGKGTDVGTAHSRMIRLERSLEAFDKPLFPHVLNLYNTYWNYILEHMEPRPHIRETMEELKKRGIRIGIGTNMTFRMQYTKIQTLGLGEYIDFMVTSEESVYDKPSPLFFDLVAEKARCPRENILFIGDNKNHDYTPARRDGLNALWYRPDLTKSIGTYEEGDLVIHDHAEIWEWIE